MWRALWLAGLICAAPAASVAQDWPGQLPLKFEVIAGAGGFIDFVPRELSNYLSASLGVPVVVENRPGAGGNIAAAVVARAPADGHTLLVTSSNQAVNPILLPNPGFDYARDLVPVSMVVSAKLLLVAAPVFPANNVTDVIKLAKLTPKSVSIGFPTVGSPNHLAAEMLAQYGDIDLNFVPYASTAQAIPDLVSNRVNLGVGAISTLLPLIGNGELKALAVISPQRSEFAPGIPTSAEAGLPALQIVNWICIMTTGGTPTPIIARLDEDIGKALALPEVRQAFAKQGVDIFHLGPQQLGEFIQSESHRYGTLLKSSRLKATAQ
jgi:tripartite-type tricarboxylate transporter receptor subunit TctC